MSLAPLPHEYPFRLVDRVTEEKDSAFSRGRVQVRVTGGQRAASGGDWSSPLWMAEVIAQSALLLQGGDAEIGRRGFLAGIDGFRASRAPIAGETLDVDVSLTARFGAIMKFRGVVSCAGAQVASGEILIRHGGAAR